MLRFVTCLAENTQGLAHTLSDYLTTKLDTSVVFDQHLAYEARKGGLLLGQISLGFSCGLLYTLLKDQGAPLQPLVAPVSLSITETTPTYYSYVIVRSERAYKAFEDLEHSSFCINEWESFSGCQIMRYHLAKLGKPKGFFARVIESGSHLESIKRVLDKKADCATIDHTLYDYWKKNNPDLATSLRVIKRLGSFPMPPLVISKRIPEAVKKEIQKALLEIPKEMLKEFNVKEFQKVSDQTYDPIREAVKLGDGVSFT